jgi:serine/threonine protein kinase
MTELVSPLAKYRPLAKLGQGGMARVFLALASGPAGFTKLVVIKEILENLVDDPEFVAMFLDEARLAARLNHPNVVQTTEVGVEDRRYYLCMEYLEGQALNHVFGRPGRSGLTRGMMIRILIDALAGLHYAHEVSDLNGQPLQIVHRDVSPHNVFLTYTGQVKVVDFGIAKAVSSTTKTQTGMLRGKVNYMAPEQAQGDKVDCRADIFSIGLILWDVLAGRRPFVGLPDVAILRKIMLGEIQSPRTIAPDIPESLDAICMKALAHERGSRFTTAAEMASALEAALDELGEKGSVRDAGKVIAAQFAEDRKRMKDLIEAQVARTRDASDVVALVPVVAQPKSEPSAHRERVAPQVETVRDEGQTGSITGAFADGSMAPPPAGPARPSRRAATIGALVLVAAAAGTAVLSLRNSTTPVASTPTPPPSSPVAPVTVRVITIDSTPQGAAVMEGDSVLGTTPMTLKIEVAATAERRLVMSLPGYTPHTFVPTADDTRVQIALAQLPTPAATRPPRPVDNARHPHPPSGPDDIKTTR